MMNTCIEQNIYIYIYIKLNIVETSVYSDCAYFIKVL